jgi:AraC family transcriptional regulator
MRSIEVLTERETRISNATIRIEGFDLHEPVNSFQRPDAAVVDMCLTSRPPNARGSYVGRFSPSDFEPLGHIFYIPADLPMRICSGAGRTRSLRCSFDRGAFADLMPQLNEYRLRETLHVASKTINQMCGRILAEMETPGFASAVVIEAMSSVIVVDLARVLSASLPSGDLPRGGIAGWRLRRIEERGRADGPPPTLEELAVLCDMSTRHLTRAFRQATGCSIGAKIEDWRVARAKALLSSDALSLKEIAYLLGFAHASAFSTAFRKATGEQPSAYRARVQAERTVTSVSGKRKSGVVLPSKPDSQGLRV